MEFFVAALVLCALNYYLYRKGERLVRRWRSGERAARWILALRIAFLLINAPFAVLAVLWLAGGRLHQLPQSVLELFFYPFFAWVVMLLAFLIVASPAEILAGIAHAFRSVFPRREPLPEVSVARRNFLATVAAVVPPVLFGIAAKGMYGADDLELSPLVKIPIPALPRGFDGLTITQISDLHAGPYIRERELARAVDMANSVRSELVVLTGDILDGSLDLLPTAQQALQRLRAPLGAYGILGNHDYYADRPSGCRNIIGGMEAIGVRMLRNQHTKLRLHGDELVLAGIDWTMQRRGNPNQYLPEPTRLALARTFEGAEAGVPRILLAHHPHVFNEAPEFQIAFTLAGHTHGGGQVVIAEVDGRPIAVGSAIFRYISGSYRQGTHRLYVNRGVGFVGLPLRIQCPPEISRFVLVRA